MNQRGSRHRKHLAIVVFITDVAVFFEGEKILERVEMRVCLPFSHNFKKQGFVNKDTQIVELSANPDNFANPN